MSMKKVLLNILRIFISLGLLAYLVSVANLKKIILVLQQVNPWAILLAILAFLIAVIFLAIRWRVLVRSHNIAVGLWHLIVFYFIGFFFNNFLPTSIGGDLSRAFYLGQFTGKKATSLGTVFLERIIGLLSTLTLAAVSLLWLIKYFHSDKIIYFTVFLILFLTFLLILFMSRRVYRKINGLISLITFYDIGDKLIKVMDSLHFYRRKKMALISAFGLSLAAQIMLIIMNYVLAQGLHLPVSFGYFFIVVPVTFIFSLFPSINGIGVRDSGYLLLLERQGLQPAQILSLSFLVVALPMLLSMIGGAFLLFYRQRGIEAPPITQEDIS